MTKFPINSKTTKFNIDPEIIKNSENASELTKAVVELIMANLKKSEGNQTELSETEAKLKNLFASWPNNVNTQQLAQLTEILTGFNPSPASTFKLGDVVMVGNSRIPMLVVGFSNPYHYALSLGISDTSLAMSTIGPGYTSAVPATTAETGLFAKDFLKVDGVTLIGMLNNNLTSILAKKFISEIGFDGVL